MDDFTINKILTKLRIIEEQTEVCQFRGPSVDFYQPKGGQLQFSVAPPRYRDTEKTGDNTGILNVPAHDYLLRGCIAMKRAELASNELDEKMFFERARASFQMSLKAKPDYLCAFRFLMDVSERLGLDDEVEEMEYTAQINPNLDHECPFLNPSYLSAEELVDIVKRSQTVVEEWAPLRNRYQAMRTAEIFKKSSQ